jgi:hypothetical protein
MQRAPKQGMHAFSVSDESQKIVRPEEGKGPKIVKSGRARHGFRRAGVPGFPARWCDNRAAMKPSAPGKAHR